jgi:hypothetical protein
MMVTQWIMLSGDLNSVAGSWIDGPGLSTPGRQGRCRCSGPLEWLMVRWLDAGS